MAKKTEPTNTDEGATAMVRVLQAVERLRPFGPFDAKWVDGPEGKRSVYSLREDRPGGPEAKDLLRLEEIVRFATALLIGRATGADWSRMRRMYAQLEENDTSLRVRVLELTRNARARLIAGHDEAVGNLRAELSWFVDAQFREINEDLIARLLKDKRKGEAAIAAELSLSVGAFGDVSPKGRKHAEAVKFISKRYTAALASLSSDVVES